MKRVIWASGVALAVCLFADLAKAGVILVSQDRYTREQFEQWSRLTGLPISQSNVTTPASGFLPFTDTTGIATQTSTVTSDAFVASGSAAAAATSGVSTYSWSVSVSHYEIVFDVVGEPQGFHYEDVTPGPALWPNFVSRLTGPGPTVFLPTNYTLDGTLSPGRWTFTINDGESFQSATPGQRASAYNSSLTFVPEPSATTCLGVAGLAALLRRRRPSGELRQ